MGTFGWFRLTGLPHQNICRRISAMPPGLLVAFYCVDLN
jgi:hypothetical protein